MRDVLSTFEEIAAPSLSAQRADTTNILLKQRSWDAELKSPRYRLGYLWIDFLRQRRFDPNERANRIRYTREFFESILRSLRIPDITGKKCPAAVELEIEVTRINPRLNKELDTTILPNLALIRRARAPNKTIFNAKDPMNRLLSMQQSNKSPWPMSAALRPKVRDLSRVRDVPHGIIPIRA